MEQTTKPLVLIGGLQKSSLIDYPEKISAIIFLKGCNFRCPYCHNPELVNKTSTSLLSEVEVLKFLKSRKDKLDGVVITGGEPTLYENLPDFLNKIKELNFLIKLDTNGSNPELLQKVISKKLVNYVAMDIKSPIDKYNKTVCAKVNIENILKSINILKLSNIDYEFRTTVVKSQLSLDDFEKIGKMIEGSKKHYLQRFLPTKTLDDNFINELTYEKNEFISIIKRLKKYIELVELR